MRRLALLLLLAACDSTARKAAAPGKDRVVQLTVLFQAMPWTFMPKETFTGTLEYDSRTIDVASMVTEAKFDKEQKLYVDTDGGCLETIGVGFAE